MARIRAGKGKLLLRSPPVALKTERPRPPIGNELMRPQTIVLIVEDSDRDYSLIRRSLELAGLHNPIKRFKSGQQALDFLSLNGRQAPPPPNQAYVLFLDVGDSAAAGLGVLEQLKQDTRLKKIPVIILTGADEPETIERSHQLGCSVYIVKPPDESALGDAIRTVGSFLSVVEVPQIGTKPLCPDPVKLMPM